MLYSLALAVHLAVIALLSLKRDEQPHRQDQPFQERSSHTLSLASIYYVADGSGSEAVHSRTLSRDEHEASARLFSSLSVRQARPSVPDVQDPQTLLVLAKISSNAYEKAKKDKDPGVKWYPIGDDDRHDPPLRHEDSFGWEDDDGIPDNLDDDGRGRRPQGLRGYIYTDPARSLAIMAIKGTSAALLDNLGRTAPLDKLNDNVMFSCCCARVDLTWRPVCNCCIAARGEAKSCSWQCLQGTARSPENYYWLALGLFKKLQLDFKGATLWVTGHSLGGALASLLALSFPGTPAVTFEAPGDRLFAQRLGLLPESPLEADIVSAGLPIFHVYHTADPIPYGACTGVLSLCYLAGYAMETMCHSGKVCEYTSAGSSQYDLQKHKLKYVIENILSGSAKVPECRVQQNCTDCPEWTFW